MKYRYAMLARPASSFTLPSGLRWTLLERGALLDTAPARTDLPRGSEPYGVIQTEGPIADPERWDVRLLDTKVTFPETGWHVGTPSPDVKATVTIRDENGFDVAHLFGDRAGERGRLIAASPDLYRELEASDIIIEQCLDLLRKHGIERSFTLRRGPRRVALYNAKG
jgi:hypothetical protein